MKVCRGKVIDSEGRERAARRKGKAASRRGRILLVASLLGEEEDDSLTEICLLRGPLQTDLDVEAASIIGLLVMLRKSGVRGRSATSTGLAALKAQALTQRLLN